MIVSQHVAPFEGCAQQVMHPGKVVTWLNHYSLLHADWDELSQVDLIGIDGTLLQVALARSGHRVERSSADLVAPFVFALLEKGTRIALIGAKPGVACKAAGRLGAFEVMCVDGYEGLSQLRADPGPLIAFAPRLVLVGLGAGLQEKIAAEVHAWVPEASVMTAGGWIDQYAASERYFPTWVHKLRLGWAWRILHEPRRLAGRYTADALRFVARRNDLIKRLEDLGSMSQWGIAVAGRERVTE